MYEDIKGKRLLILGGTRISCEIVHQAKKMGLVVAVADYNPPSESPGKQISDENYLVSVTDVDKTVELIKDRHFDGVLTGFSDQLLPYYAEICEKAGLPSYGTRDQFVLLSNKTEYKKKLEEYDIPTVKSFSEYDVIDSGEYPLLVKPVDGSGSRGISICSNENELTEAIEKAKLHSRCKKCLIEKYLSGREVTVNWLFDNGNYYLTCIGNRHVKNNQGVHIIPLPVGYTYPASITKAYMNNTYPKVCQMLKSLNIKNGMMFMQCKVVNNECVVYDIGFRLTGALEYRNLELTCGFNPLAMLIYFSITGKMCFSDETKKIDPLGMKPSFNVSTLISPGKIASIVGVDEVKENTDIDDVILAHVEGETITDDMRGLLTQICIRTIGKTSSSNNLFGSMKKIEKTLKVYSDTGNIMNLSGIEEKDIEGFVL